MTTNMVTSVSGEWCHWNNHMGEYVYPTDHVPDYTSILVPNVDNTRTSFLLETIAKQRKVSFLKIIKVFFRYKTQLLVCFKVCLKDEYGLHIGHTAYW